MLFFNCDYNEGAHPLVMDALCRTNLEQTIGYGEDPYCEEARRCIRGLCGDDKLYVQFLAGGTQTNLTVISAALRPHQGVLCAKTGHINVHETGAIEACGHKVMALPSKDGKIMASQVVEIYKKHVEDETFEHMVQPKMVYISNPTELGTIYYKKELEELSSVCRRSGLYLFMDGARLGYGLASAGNDLELADIARLCDVFYIGGTKVGALFGEAVVISNTDIKKDFRYIIKQKGGLFAKGRLLGIQFLTLLKDGLYFDISRHAVIMADRIRVALKEAGYPFFVETPSNQIFVTLQDEKLKELQKDYVFSYYGRANERSSTVRICTSWATKKENADLLTSSILRGAVHAHAPLLQI